MIVNTFQHRHAGHCESGVTANLLSFYGLKLSEPMALGLSGTLTFAHLPFVKVGGFPLTTYRMPPGSVYKGLRKPLGREVALKVLRPELAQVVGAERFLREIKMAARLTHAGPASRTVTSSPRVVPARSKRRRSCAQPATAPAARWRCARWSSRPPVPPTRPSHSPDRSAGRPPAAVGVAQRLSCRSFRIRHPLAAGRPGGARGG